MSSLHQMDQSFSHLDSPKSDQIPLQTLRHPKIKPLLRRDFQEKQLNETTYQKSLKMHSKTFRAVKTITDRGRSTSIRYITGYTKNLKAQDSLSKLSYSFNNNACPENIYLFPKIKSLRNLRSLDVQFLRNRGPIPLEVLCKSLAYMKNLTHFRIELNLYSFTENDHQILFILFRSLRRLKQLKSLSLRFSLCRNFQNAKMNNLPPYLSRLKQLQSLELSSNRSMGLADHDDIMDLASMCTKLPLLTQISLDFEGQMRVIQGPTLVELLQNMRNLSEFTLNLGDSKIMKTESTADPLSEGLRLLHAPSLKKLNLRLNQNLDTQGFIELSQTIKRFTSLNTLHLDFFSCKSLPNVGIPEFSAALNSLTSLSSFNFRVNFYTQADSVIGCIASGIKSSQNLVNLKLHFGNVRSSPDQFQQLSSSLRNLNSLKFLDICFASIQCISDDILQNLGEGLLHLVQLKHLKLDFCAAKTMTKRGIEIIVNAVQELHGLSALDLNFAYNPDIDEKVIENIAQVLRHLPSLYTVKLRIARSPKLKENERSLCSLFNALRDMKNIREVLLIISHNEINEKEVDSLKKRKIVDIAWV